MANQEELIRFMWIGICFLLLSGKGCGFDVHRPIDTSYDVDTLVDPSLVFPLGDIAPIPRVHHSLVMNSKFLIVYGGYSNNGTILGDTNLYHMPTQIWSGPITKETCCNDQQEVVDVIGVAKRYEFSFLKTGFEGDYPLSRAEHAACIVNDLMYIFGGITPDYAYMNDLYAFDSYNLAWSPVYSTGGADSLPRRRAGHALLGYGDRYIYLFGGRSIADQRTIGLNDLWKFDVQEKLWERSDDLTLLKPDVRHYMGSAILHDQLYVFCGSDPNSNLLHHDLWSFSIKAGIWSLLFSGISRENAYEYVPPPLIHSHLIPVSTANSDGLIVYGGIGSGGACVGADSPCKQRQVAFGQVYLYSLMSESWLQPFQTNDYEIEQSTLRSHWVFARLTNGTKGLSDPSNVRYAKLTKSYAMEKIVVNSFRKSFYEFGGVRSLDLGVQNNHQEVWDEFPQSQDTGGFTKSDYTDTESGEHLRFHVATPVNAMWTFRNQYDRTANVSFENVLRLFSLAPTDVVLVSEYIKN
jgi:hypothetical protein